MDLNLVIGNNSWKFHDDAMIIVKKVWQTDILKNKANLRDLKAATGL